MPIPWLSRKLRMDFGRIFGRKTSRKDTGKETNLVEIYVLDACAVIAVLLKEKGYDLIGELYEKAARNEIQMIMHRINLLEVYYKIYHKISPITADDTINKITQSNLNILPDLDDQIFKHVAYYKHSYEISFADTFVLASSKKYNGTIVTADHEFDPIEQQEKIPILWFR
jgi:predicted nucleic acid-binding protein